MAYSYGESKQVDSFKYPSLLSIRKSHSKLQIDQSSSVTNRHVTNDIETIVTDFRRDNREKTEGQKKPKRISEEFIRIRILRNRH